MKILLVADLHDTLRQGDWVLSVGDRFDMVVVAGDLLDIGSIVPLEAQIVVVTWTFFARARHVKTDLWVGIEEGFRIFRHMERAILFGTHFGDVRPIQQNRNFPEHQTRLPDLRDHGPVAGDFHGPFDQKEEMAGFPAFLDHHIPRLVVADRESGAFGKEIKHSSLKARRSESTIQQFRTIMVRRCSSRSTHGGGLVDNERRE